MAEHGRLTQHQSLYPSNVVPTLVRNNLFGAMGQFVFIRSLDEAPHGRAQHPVFAGGKHQDALQSQPKSIFHARTPNTITCLGSYGR